MKTNELIKLKIGQYQLTDGIYNYTLTVGKNLDKSKFYTIYEKGDSKFSAHIFITLKMKINEDGKKYKSLSAMAGVGGLKIHSDNIYSLLSELKFA